MAPFTSSSTPFCLFLITSMICGRRAFAASIFCLSFSGVSKCRNEKQTFDSGITTVKSASACRRLPSIAFSPGFAASSLLNIVMASPILSPHVVSAQQYGAGEGTIILRTKSRKMRGGCHPCVGKQNPMRSPSCNSNSYRPSLIRSGINSSSSPMASAICLATHRVLPVPVK